MYFNSVIGIIVRGAYAQSQFATRSQLQVGAIPGLPCPQFQGDNLASAIARNIASEKFSKLATMQLEPFAYCFRDTNRHQIDDAVAEMLRLDPVDASVQQMLSHYRKLLASEPNVNGRQKKIVDALREYAGWGGNPIHSRG